MKKLLLLSLIMVITVKTNDAAIINQRPLVGVAVLVIKDGKLLLGKRKNAHGSGSWSPTGGHLEFGESPEICAERETFEETGMRIKNIHFGYMTNDIFEVENKHYITLFMIAEHDSGDPMVLEPEKCEGWQWFSFDELPQPLFLTVQNLIRKVGGYENFKQVLLK